MRVIMDGSAGGAGRKRRSQQKTREQRVSEPTTSAKSKEKLVIELTDNECLNLPGFIIQHTYATLDV